MDIDETMIGIGKTYFGLGSMKSLTLICDDAQHFIKTYTGASFDCIVTDVFIGSDVPSFLILADFQKHMRKMLTSNGYILVNYAFRTGAKDVSSQIHAALEVLYMDVRQHTTRYNRFFLAK